MEIKSDTKVSSQESKTKTFVSRMISNTPDSHFLLTVFGWSIDAAQQQMALDFKLVEASDAASGWAGWALAHPELGNSVNPVITRGADFAHRITDCPPGFENPAASLL